mmetsp:Transcript_51907/g.56217  ORF Transcript_51907/g.56217 Transcript_51907/m.56217 type:complete len:89 (+) Transcript_51907:239-505(+)
MKNKSSWNKLSKDNTTNNGIQLYFSLGYLANSPSADSTVSIHTVLLCTQPHTHILTPTSSPANMRRHFPLVASSPSLRNTFTTPVIDS